MRHALVLTVVVVLAVACATAQHIPTTPPLPSPSVQQIVQMQRPTVSLHLPLRNGQSRACTLAQRAGDNDGVVTTMTSDGVRTWSASERWVTYRGTTEDGGVAIVTFHTSGELRATILYTDSVRTIASLADRPLNPSYGMQMTSVGAFTCATPEAEPTSRVVRALANVHKLPEMQQQLDTITVRCAVEVDYDMVEAIRSVAGTETYVANVLAVMSTVYEREVRARLVLSNLRVWGNPNDPYPTEESVFTLLDIFVDEYEKNMSQVPRDLAMFLTMRGGQGGIARTIGGLCESGSSYCAGDVLQTIANYPTWSWDVGMLTHEIGHLAGAIHTQSCYWPGGPLDSCITSESGTCVEYDDVRPTRGTIMSYCHQLLDQGATMALEFHPLHRRVVRSFLERATCLGNMPLPATSVLRGRVIDATSRAPLVNLELTLRPVASDIYRRMPAIDGDTVVRTDADGQYTFRGLGTGLYEVVLASGYLVAPFTRPQTQRRNAVMVVDSVVTYDMELIRGRALRVTIANTDERDVSLTIYSTMFADLMVQGRIADRSYTTMLPAGRYIIVPTANGYRFAPQKIVLDVTTDRADTIVVPIAASVNNDTLTTLSLGYALYAEPHVGSQIVMTGGAPYTLTQNESSTLVASGTTPDDGVVVLEDVSANASYSFRMLTSENDSAVVAPYSQQYWISPAYSLNSALIVDIPRRRPLLARAYTMSVRNGSYAELVDPQVVFNQRTKNTRPVVIDLPFDVRALDRRLTSLTVYRSGFVSLNGDNLPAWVSQPLSETTLSDIVIAAFAAELYPDTNAPNPWHVGYVVRGEAPNRSVTIEWRNLTLRTWDVVNGNTIEVGRYAFQLTIHEDGTLDMTYDAPVGVTQRVFAQIGLRGSDVRDNLVLASRADDDLRNVTADVTQDGSSRVVFESNAALPAGTIYHWEIATSSLDDQTEEPVALRPNPATSFVEITAAPLGAIVRVVDPLGRCVLTHVAATERPALSLDGLAAGRYVVTVATPTHVSSYPLILLR